MRSLIFFANKSKNLLSFYDFCPYQLASECLQHTSVTRNEVGNVMLRNKTVKKFSNSRVKKQRVNKIIWLTFLKWLIYFEIPPRYVFCCSLIQHCIKIVFSSILEFYHNIWYWNLLLNQSFTAYKPTILQALLEMDLQYIPNDRNISWRSFDSFSV